jgi:ribosomal protein S27E
MKALSEEEDSKLMSGHCPDCGSTTFLHGPCGGMAENIRCNGCGSEFWFAPPFSAERLERNCPECYQRSFDLKNELKQMDMLVENSNKSWWKRLFRL